MAIVGRQWKVQFAMTTESDDLILGRLLRRIMLNEDGEYIHVAEWPRQQPTNVGSITLDGGWAITKEELDLLRSLPVAIESDE